MSDRGNDESGGRPSGRLRPEEGEPEQIHDSLVDQEYEEALERLEELEPSEGIDRDWIGYLRGLGLLGTRELDDAYESFRSTAERITSTPREELGEDRFRIAAKCLKKMGWYHRRGDGHARAYAYHAMEYDLIESYGSALELHDAALSLDVVSYHLRTPQISRGWIERSIDAASDIDGDAARRKALGISWNNLTGTLCDLGEFEEAGHAADESLEQWRAYEELEGPEENRVIWAKHIFGDAYKRWGDSLIAEREQQEGRQKLEVARTALTEAVEEAEEREMSDSDLEDIQGKLDGVLESLDSLEETDDQGDETGDAESAEDGKPSEDDGASTEEAQSDEENDESGPTGREEDQQA